MRPPPCTYNGICIIVVLLSLLLQKTYGFVTTPYRSTTTSLSLFQHQYSNKDESMIRTVCTSSSQLLQSTILVDAPTKQQTQQQSSTSTNVYNDDIIIRSSNNHIENDSSNNDSNDIPPSLGEIRKLLPKSVFQVDTQTSLLYFGLDLMAVMGSMSFLYAVVTSDYYHSLLQTNVLLQGAMVLPIQLMTGFAMWCMWCIGHDAGHTTISKHRKYGTIINRIVGEISHSMICLTPFIPWKKSHLQHHLNHNHLERDYSHQWFVREDAHNLHPLIQLSYHTRNVQLPILYLVYLLFGVPDGGHVYFYGRLWDNETLSEKIKASISVLISIATAATLWTTMGTVDFIVVCFVPWLILSMWLFTVTYLQHHSHDGKLYTDDTWTFTKGAFETVDRNYGDWVNRLSHHMMDGHVIHHLFFTRVPHYHLKEATDALQVGMKQNGNEQFYKQIDTQNFGYEIVKQFNENWFFCNESQVVRK